MTDRTDQGRRGSGASRLLRLHLAISGPLAAASAVRQTRHAESSRESGTFDLMVTSRLEMAPETNRIAWISGGMR